MKQVINFILSALAPFASVPTGWAIFAGVTEQSTFPMPDWVAFIGASAVIATTAAAALLIVDILKHNQEAQTEEERKLNLSVWSAWAILIGCIAGEILLSLVIVVVPGWLAFGVLAFPLMTLAGVFAFALRLTLAERMGERDALRARHAQEVEQERTEEKAKEEAAKAEAERLRAERRADRLARKAEKLAAKPKPSEPEPALAEIKPAFVCSCGDTFASQPALNAHQRKHKQTEPEIAGYAVEFTPIKEQIQEPRHKS